MYIYIYINMVLRLRLLCSFIVHASASYILSIKNENIFLIYHCLICKCNCNYITQTQRYKNILSTVAFLFFFFLFFVVLIKRKFEIEWFWFGSDFKRGYHANGKPGELYEIDYETNYSFHYKKQKLISECDV